MTTFYDCWNSNDIDGVLECFTESVVYHDAVFLEPFFGKDALRQFFLEFSSHEGLRALNFQVQELVADDTSCSVAWCAHPAATRRPRT